MNASSIHTNNIAYLETFSSCHVFILTHNNLRYGSWLSKYKNTLCVISPHLFLHLTNKRCIVISHQQVEPETWPWPLDGSKPTSIAYHLFQSFVNVETVITTFNWHIVLCIYFWQPIICIFKYCSPVLLQLLIQIKLSNQKHMCC